MSMITVSDKLRATIRKSGLSTYRLEIETGVDRMCINRFLEGKPIVSHNFDRLCQYFGMKLTGPTGGKRNKTKKG